MPTVSNIHNSGWRPHQRRMKKAATANHHRQPGQPPLRLSASSAAAQTAPRNRRLSKVKTPTAPANIVSVSTNKTKWMARRRVEGAGAILSRTLHHQDLFPAAFARSTVQSLCGPRNTPGGAASVGVHGAMTWPLSTKQGQHRLEAQPLEALPQESALAAKATRPPLAGKRPGAYATVAPHAPDDRPALDGVIIADDMYNR